ncbi:MAG: aspartate-semialdehyde dehydrogenase [Holosporales bacterium]|jgi:aspartate-semialdehyde dehydrogenase|nr:aspartate-semialdehyde dehydrogenase [Holosporales bacterium]
MRNKKIIVVGATGKVGREILSILREENIPAQNIAAAASYRSKGSLLDYSNSKIEVSDLDDVDFASYDIAIFSAGGEVSKKYVPIATKAGCVAIDNTSYFRMDKTVPLVVPEINFSDIEKYENKKIIANPNCSTIQTVMVLKPLHDIFGLKEAVISTYQSVSGAGQKGVAELLSQTQDLLSRNSIEPHYFKKQIAFNIIPQIDVFTDSLYTKEELKMMNETKKILGIDNIEITATCARVPVFVGHAVSVFAKFHKTVDLKKAVAGIENFNGVKIMDDPKNYEYATPLDAASKNEVFVSRIRKHPTTDNAISFWCVCDNLRKGAALNAVQIAKRLFSD